MGTQEKHYTCNISGLPVVELDDFTNVDFGHGYKLNLRKIGDSIIHSRNEGNMRYSNIERYTKEIEDFITKANVQKPYIEIRDMSDLIGRSPSKQYQLQVNYLKDHESDLAGIVVCGASGLADLVVKSAFRLIKTKIQKVTCKNFEEAIHEAIKIQSNSQTFIHEHYSQDDLITKPEWNIKTDRSEVIYGIINQKIFYTSLAGTFYDEDIPSIGHRIEKVLEAGEFSGRSYIRIADYSKLHKIKLHPRRLYGKAVDGANKKLHCKPSITYLCGANSFMKAAMQIYRIANKQEFVYVDSVEEAFQIINSKKGNIKAKAQEIYITQNDIDEIINLGGSLIWGGTQRIDHLVSKTNPLWKVAETLSVVQVDLDELRERDIEQNKVLTESLEKMRNLAKELKQSDDETQQLNEELRSANDQLFAQKEELESAKIQLMHMNNNLENLVKERTEKLKLTVDKLNKSVSELDRFVYSASHDLSAPLKSMLGLLHIARKDPDENQTEKYFDYLEKSIYNLEDVIQSLISYSRNSRLEVKRESIDLKELVNEVISELAFLPMQKSVRFEICIDDQKFIKSDRQRLKVILHNLINNSVKYADYDKSDPHVIIRFEQKADQNVIYIEDNGIGIATDQKEKVFEMFYRGTEKSKGSGLGLFIVHETITALKGSIDVRSTENEGATFYFSFPS